jgi:hypothetical protein
MAYPSTHAGRPKQQGDAVCFSTFCAQAGRLPDVEALCLNGARHPQEARGVRWRLQGRDYSIRVGDGSVF